MNTFRTTSRLLITASLLLALCATSLYPRFVSGNGRIGAVASNHGQGVCCCGTKDGRCCGMACCQLPNPKEDKAPASSTPSEDRGQPLGLAIMVDSGEVGPKVAALRTRYFLGAADVSSGSLVALSIRLNT